MTQEPNQKAVREKDQENRKVGQEVNQEADLENYLEVDQKENHEKGLEEVDPKKDDQDDDLNRFKFDPIKF